MDIVPGHSGYRPEDLPLVKGYPNTPGICPDTPDIPDIDSEIPVLGETLSKISF
jgi:hypothetical protein